MPVPARTFLRLTCMVVLTFTCSGCSQELGPENLPTTSTKGVVKLAGKPISSGWVEFWPIKGTLGNFRTARIRPDGTFEAQGVAIGTNRLVLVHAPIGEIATLMGPIPGQIFSSSVSSPIEREIKPDGEPITLDLGPIAYDFARKNSRGGRTGRP